MVNYNGADVDTNVAEDGDLILRVGQDHWDTTLDIRVSSEVLTKKSLVFNAMLNGHFTESQLLLNSEDPPILDLPEDHAICMLKLCKILDPGVRDPGVLVLPCFMLGVGVLVDKYACQKATRGWLTLRLLHPDFVRVSNTAEEMTEIIQTTYLFEHAEAFHLYTRKAIMAATSTDDLGISSLSLGNALADGFARALGGITASLWSRLSQECQMALDQLKDVESGIPYIERFLAAQSVFTTSAGPYNTSRQCEARAERVEKWTAAMDQLGLSAGSPDHPRLSLMEVLEDFDEVQRKMILTDCSIGAREVLSSSRYCSTCARNWEPVRAMLKEFRKEVRGVCLVCLKGEVSGIEGIGLPAELRKCQEHRINYPTLLSATIMHEEYCRVPMPSIIPFGYVMAASGGHEGLDSE